MLPRALAFAPGLVALMWADAANALGPNASAIDTSDYTIDFHQGPITGSSRVIGLAGSITPLLEGVGAYAVNPASAAARVPWSLDWFDWELDFSFTFPSSITDTDFDNNGDATFATNAAAFVNAGVGLQLGAWGIGFRVDAGEYRIETRGQSPDAARELEVSMIQGNLATGYAFSGGEIVVGYGIDISAVELALPGGSDASSIASVEGVAMQIGGLWAPADLPLRLGVSARWPVSDEESKVPEGVEPDESGNYISDGYYLPREIRVPAELHVAVAVQWFRPLNVRWRSPDDRARSIEGPPSVSRAPTRRPGKLLVAAALQVTGAVSDGVGIESFFSQEVERSGKRTSYSPRIGVEGEPLSNWLLLRGGSYLEPTRFDAGASRLHATAGFDVHVPIEWSVFGLFDADTTFRVGGAVDTAERYFAWTASAGVWR